VDQRTLGGTLVLKGIMEAADARLAVASGADALIVSNHGGRQLDGAPAELSTSCSVRLRFFPTEQRPPPQRLTIP
jgi:isopentenyl diphosphate isomerase/L-lactate dehydrogenase-like FMN-dependent dehydrogenase